MDGGEEERWGEEERMRCCCVWREVKELCRFSSLVVVATRLLMIYVAFFSFLSEHHISLAI